MASNLRSVILFLAGAAAGFLAGSWRAPAPSPAPLAIALPPAPPEPSPPPPAAPPAPTAAELAANECAPWREYARSLEEHVEKVGAQTHALSAESARFKARVAELEGLARAPRPPRDEASSDVLAPPDNLAAHYSPEAVRTAIERALKDGLGGGEVTSVDCTEYPCIVFGELPEDAPKDVFKLLEDTAAMQPYENGPKSTWLSRFGKGTKPIFGVAMWPSGEPQDRSEQIPIRVGRRAREMMEAMKPPPKK